MNSIRLILAILFILSTSLSANKKKDPVVASVNGEQIHLSELEETFRQNKLFLSTTKVSRQKVLNDLINKRIGIQRARKSGLHTMKVVKDKMEDVLYHAQISKDLEPTLKKIEVKDEEVKGYYEKNKEYRTAHILLRITADASENEVKAAFNQSMKIYDQLKTAPEKFHELANKFTQSSASSNGGDVGFQPPIRLAPEYFKAINEKPVGFISLPVRTQFGFHIIKVLGVKDYKSINKDLYKKIVYDQKRDAALEAYFSNLRDKSNIKIEKSYLR